MKVASSERKTSSHHLHPKKKIERKWGVRAQPIRSTGLLSHTQAQTDIRLHLVGADKRNFPPHRESSKKKKRKTRRKEMGNEGVGGGRETVGG